MLSPSLDAFLRVDSTNQLPQVTPRIHHTMEDWVELWVGRLGGEREEGREEGGRKGGRANLLSHHKLMKRHKQE